MEYRELCRRLNIEIYQKGLKGQADAKDSDVHIKHMDDENKHCFVHINGVQMKFRRIQLGLQKVVEGSQDDLWLLICGSEEKCIRIKDIKEIYFNYRGWETVHG